MKSGESPANLADLIFSCVSDAIHATQIADARRASPRCSSSGRGASQLLPRPDPFFCAHRTYYQPFLGARFSALADEMPPGDLADANPSRRMLSDRDDARGHRRARVPTVPQRPGPVLSRARSIPPSSPRRSAARVIYSTAAANGSPGQQPRTIQRPLPAISASEIRQGEVARRGARPRRSTSSVATSPTCSKA